MPNNWDRFDDQDELPFFTLEERERIDRVYRELQRKYDPVMAEAHRTGRMAFTSREEDADYKKRLRDAEMAAGVSASRYR